MELSEILQAEADDAGGHGETFGREHRSDLEHYAALARALEERVAELERLASRHGPAHPIMVKQCLEERDAANARAEVAEAEVARQIKLAMGYADERDALRAKMEKVRAVAVKWAVNAHPAAYVGARDIRSILDGEGDNES